METSRALPWITIFHPVAPLQEEAYLPLSGTVSPNDKKSLSLRKACVDAYKTILESVEQSSSDFHTSNYEAPNELETYGGRKHLENLADNMVRLAYDFFLELHVKSESLSKRPIELHIIAAESGVYLAMRVINFLAKYGLHSVFLDSFKKFIEAWHRFLLEGEDLEPPTEWPWSQRLVNITIVSVILIHPSLPSSSPKNRLRFYGKNPPPINHGMQRRVLVVWFKNDHINTAVYEIIPISGRHIQMLEFDNVLDLSYEKARQSLVENLDATCSECK